MPTIQDTIHPELYLTAGPFSSGARESATDPLYEHGGFSGIMPEEGMEHHSILNQGGKVSWRRDTVDDKGILRVKQDTSEPDWDFWKDYKGRTFTRCRNYAWTTFEVKQPTRALVIARGTGSFRLNGERFSGDFYNNKYLKVPVNLKKGTNEVLLGLSGSPSSAAYFALIPVEYDIQAITADITAPDIQRGRSYDTLYLGLPFVNNTNKWNHNINTEIYYTTPGGEQKRISQKELPSIGPLAYQHSAFSLDLSSLQWNTLKDQDSIPLEIIVHQKHASDTFYSELSIKEQDSPYNITFLDSDHSVQFYSAFPPKDMDPDKSYPAIFMLHGAGVNASGSNGYTQKDWTYVIAPTNRRRYGFDWEKQGKVNALNSLHHAKQELGLDMDRIYLTGHSMGGHGSWVAGISHPHLFAALAPSAAWTSFDIYTPFVSRKDHLMGNPANLQLLYAGLQPTRTLSMVENLNNLPVYILHGGSDKSVPPDHPRLFFKRLSQLGYEVSYNEVSGKGHWWKFEDTEGTDCVDHADIMEFFRGKQRNSSPNHIRFKTSGLAESHRAYWISVLQRSNFTDESQVNAKVETHDNGKTINLETFNIRKLEIHLDEAPFDPEHTSLFVDGKEIPISGKHSMKILPEHPILSQVESTPVSIKSPTKAGPVKQVFYEPFALVFATQGGKAWEQQTYAQARRLAQSWYYRGNGKTIIIPDTLVDKETQEQFNLILFGSPETNAYYQQINKDLPIRVYADSIVMGSKYREELNLFQRLSGQKACVFGHKKVYHEDLSVKFIYPNPKHPERFVQVNGGASLQSQALSMEPAMISSADGLPDYLIFDELIRQKGFAALINAGFFDNTWHYNPEHAFIQPPGMRN
ncbi:MAG: prolyl oligopeptidase family serine peptidase [Bacteroidales bacterium]